MMTKAMGFVMLALGFVALGTALAGATHQLLTAAAALAIGGMMVHTARQEQQQGKEARQ